jgi:hypothetical protein
VSQLVEVWWEGDQRWFQVNSAEQQRIAQHSTAQLISILQWVFSTAQHSTVQHNTAHRSMT